MPVFIIYIPLEIIIKMNINKWMSLLITMETLRFSEVTANSTNGNHTALIKTDIMAEMLQHETMTFFAILVMLCKFTLFYFFIC